LKEENKHYVDTSRVFIREINKAIAKDMIVTYHYSHAWTMCRYALGVFYKTDEKDILENDEKLIGVAVYGFPVGRSAVTSIIDGLGNDQCLELTRLFIHDGYGSNIESYALGQTFKWLRENAPNIKMLLSYSDPFQGHLGGIYRATNWLFQDTNKIQLMPNYGICLESEDGQYIHSRTVFSRWGSHNLEHLKTEIGKDGYKEFWRRKEMSKLRYIQILPTNKSEKKRLLKALKHPCETPPSDIKDILPAAERYETYEPENKVNFW
jgi:hypothetical protein